MDMKWHGKKGTFKTRRQTKQIYIYDKTYIDTLKYRYGSINKRVICVYVLVCVCVCVYK